MYTMPELYLGPSTTLSDVLVPDGNDNPVVNVEMYQTAARYNELYDLYTTPETHRERERARRYGWRYEKGLIRPWKYWLKVAKKQRERALKRQRRLKRKQ